MGLNFLFSKRKVRTPLDGWVKRASDIVPNSKEMVVLIARRVADLDAGAQPLIPVLADQDHSLTAIQELVARKIGPTPEDEAEQRRLRKFVERLADESFPSLAGKG